MVKAVLFSKTGDKSAHGVSLPKEIFEVGVTHHGLLHQALRRQLAQRRMVSAKTLKRGEVRGGGRKPWRQKGSGRARHGSIRSPLWRGGGVIFGPSGQENYQIQLSKQAKRQAIRQALSLKAKDGAINVIEDFSVKEGRTKEVNELIKKLGAARQTLLVVDPKNPKLEQAARNLPGVKVTGVQYLNVFDVLKADSLILTEPALKAITAWLGKSTKVARESKS